MGEPFSAEPQKELLKVLKTRFEANMNRHKVYNGLRFYTAFWRWKIALRSSMRSMKWRELAVNRM